MEVATGIHVVRLRRAHDFLAVQFERLQPDGKRRLERMLFGCFNRPSIVVIGGNGALCRVRREKLWVSSGRPVAHPKPIGTVHHVETVGADGIARGEHRPLVHRTFEIDELLGVRSRKVILERALGTKARFGADICVHVMSAAARHVFAEIVGLSVRKRHVLLGGRRHAIRTKDRMGHVIKQHLAPLPQTGTEIAYESFFAVIARLPDFQTIDTPGPHELRIPGDVVGEEIEVQTGVDFLIRLFIEDLHAINLHRLTADLQIRFHLVAAVRLQRRVVVVDVFVRTVPQTGPSMGGVKQEDTRVRLFILTRIEKGTVVLVTFTDGIPFHLRPHPRSRTRPDADVEPHTLGHINVLGPHHIRSSHKIDRAARVEDFARNRIVETRATVLPARL